MKVASTALLIRPFWVTQDQPLLHQVTDASKRGIFGLMQDHVQRRRQTSLTDPSARPSRLSFPLPSRLSFPIPSRLSFPPSFTALLPHSFTALLPPQPSAQSSRVTLSVFFTSPFSQSSALSSESCSTGLMLERMQLSSSLAIFITFFKFFLSIFPYLPPPPPLPSPTTPTYPLGHSPVSPLNV